MTDRTCPYRDCGGRSSEKARFCSRCGRAFEERPFRAGPLLAAVVIAVLAAWMIGSVVIAVRYDRAAWEMGKAE